MINVHFTIWRISFRAGCRPADASWRKRNTETATKKEKKKSVGQHQKGKEEMEYQMGRKENISLLFSAHSCLN